ncbi:hypothetical protein AYY19_14970 [Photobacterium aquimaris]|uniref:DUF2850 domain-containing protein n=1 Tax=Photobacterium aquimaris TaxID=512643 RepID=A0A2T3IGD3_9GAMM|nr:MULTISPECIES: DUF2850 domain-containing protein [Photobacterium]OBU16753.1 hypothetical protein AYY19_14970 [Photobacterium aquimaris]OBU19567.1 hypothetical protein AYY20_17735 [Photobacterium aquimaris]PSU25841.1 DUF2850 domain-containing protein [Photobacterium aquimaris]PSV97940.1 DUF2850 domain-containing protein [Photobacterium aquimaris]
MKLQRFWDEQCQYGRWVIIIVITVIVFAIGALKLQTTIDQHQQLMQQVMGEWQEQGVAPDKVETFEVRQQGIYRQGRLLTSNYSWNGTQLRYQFGDQLYSYRYQDNTLIRYQSAHYSAVFERQ